MVKSVESLESLYNKIKDTISKVDFSLLWEGFEPLKFALYNDTECFFDGHYIEKTADFCANTAIRFTDGFDGKNADRENTLCQRFL